MNPYKMMQTRKPTKRTPRVLSSSSRLVTTGGRELIAWWSTVERGGNDQREHETGRKGPWMFLKLVRQSDGDPGIFP